MRENRGTRLAGFGARTCSRRTVGGGEAEARAGSLAPRPCPRRTPVQHRHFCEWVAEAPVPAACETARSALCGLDRGVRVTWSRKFWLREYARTSLWIVPVCFVTVAVLAGIFVPEIDRSTESDLTFSFGVAAAIAALSAIAGGMITFTGFVFSVLLVAIQFGSSQFSPRLLGALFRRTVVKVAIGSFVATFTYALLVLASTARRGEGDFVPTLSVTVAIALLLLSVAMFLLLLQRVGHDLRTGSVLHGTGRIGSRLIDKTYPDEAPEDEPRQDAYAETLRASHARLVRRDGGSLVLQGADFDGIAAAAREVDAVVVLEPAVGDFVWSGAPLFRVLESGRRIDDELLGSSLAFGSERTIEQDLPFVFRILVDIAAKALSPGVNDPTTAVQALDQIDDLLGRLVTRRLAIGEARDDDGRLRACWPVPSWESYLGLALTEIRQYGEGSVQISRRLRALLEHLHDEASPYRRPAVERQLALLDESVRRGFAPAELNEATEPDRQGVGGSASTGSSRSV